MAAEPGSMPCGPAAEAGSLCLSIYRSTGNGVLAQLSDSLVVRPAKIVFILAMAYVVRKVRYRLLGRLVDGKARRVDGRSTRQHRDPLRPADRLAPQRRRRGGEVLPRASED